MNRHAILPGLLVLAVVSPHTARAEPPLTYRALLDQVAERNPNIREARARVAAAEGDLSLVWSAWRPTLEANGQVKYSTQQVELDMGQLLGGLATSFGIDPSTLDLPPPTVIEPHWSVAGVARVRQLIFDPSAWHAPGVARAAVRAQERAADATTDELLFAAAQLYAGLQAVDALEAAARRAVDSADARAKDAKVRVDAGLATPLDITRAETRKTEAESQLAQLVAQRRSLLADLQALLGAESPVAVVHEPMPADLGPAGDGPEGRSDVLARQAALEAAEKEWTRTRWLWLPSLVFEAQATATNVGGFTGNHVFGSGFIALSLPLYDGGARYARKDTAEAKAMAAQAALDGTRGQARALIEKAAAHLEGAQAQLTLAEAQLNLADQAVTQVNSLHDSGLATSLDLDDADTRRFAADRQVAERALDVALSRLRLHYARGGRLR
jgi:outer membrane protein